jgi:hypothetical protein
MAGTAGPIPSFPDEVQDWREYSEEGKCIQYKQVNYARVGLGKDPDVHVNAYSLCSPTVQKRRIYRTLFLEDSQQLDSVTLGSTYDRKSLLKN